MKYNFGLYAMNNRERWQMAYGSLSCHVSVMADQFSQMAVKAALPSRWPLVVAR